MNQQQHDLGLCTDLEAIDRFLAVDGQFLIDAGCGNMHLSRSLAERGANVLAIDPDPVQARKNLQADTIANVGFAQTGAEAVPVESKSVDGVLFPYSLHHIPSDKYAAVFEEIHRILKPGGYVYAIEPVASGDLNEVMRLFHDEQLVRESAQKALDSFGARYFDQVDVITYRIPIKYGSWEEYAARYVSKSFNTDYTEAEVRADAVRDRFIELGEKTAYAFESPMKVTYLRNTGSDVGVA
ncbi:MAG: class I SAM-dependent methyltransferase [Granulosicoccus sp.]